MNNIKKKKVAVLGATGYTGTELIRLLICHPSVDIIFASSESYAGMKLEEVHPQFNGLTDLVCSPLDPDAIPSYTDLVFCALPHGKSAEVVPAIRERGFSIIDLSADFRLKDASLYPLWYDRSHPSPGLLPQAVYGLPELYREEVRKADFIANPGCYPTGILLALAPLAKEKILNKEGIIIDAKSGVSGAGRSPKQPFHLPECNENFKAYRVNSHQHIPEIEQELSFMTSGIPGIQGDKEGDKTGSGHVTVIFTPHLVPMNRGLLSTIYVSLLEDRDEKQLYNLYYSFYRDESFVRILEPPALPETRWVRGTNFCDLALRRDERTGRVIIISAIDNLVKGAAGQAIQNMNIIYGWKDDTSLRLAGMTP